MIEGTVNAALEAVISLSVSGPSGQMQQIDAVVDTGYNGFLTLPPAMVARLGLPFLNRGRATLANGREDLFDVCDATVRLDRQAIGVEADAADTIPLVGMALLEGHSLNVDVHRGGRVLITSGQAA